MVQQGLVPVLGAPCVLFAPKAYDTLCFCTVFCKVYSVTTPDSFPLPRMEDFIDRTGSAFFHLKKLPVPVLDLLKVVLTEKVLAGQSKQIKAKEHR